MKDKDIVSVGFYKGYKKASKEISDTMTNSIKRNKNKESGVIEDMISLMFGQAANTVEIREQLEEMKKSPNPFYDIDDDKCYEEESEIEEEEQEEDYFKISKEGLHSLIVIKESGVSQYILKDNKKEVR